MSRLPESKAMASTTVAGVTLELHVLDDGRRVIRKEGMDALFAKMATGSISSADVSKLAMWARRALQN
jgi:hypothetical protein